MAKPSVFLFIPQLLGFCLNYLRKADSPACVTLVLEALLIFFGELRCCSDLLASCCPGRYQLFHRQTAAVLCSTAACGSSLWRCRQAQDSACSSLGLCLLRAPHLCADHWVSWDLALLRCLWSLGKACFSDRSSCCLFLLLTLQSKTTVCFCQGGYGYHYEEEWDVLG